MTVALPSRPGLPFAASETGGEARDSRSDGDLLYAHVKRFRERWVADERFRAAVRDDPRAAAARAGLDVDPSPLAFLWRSGPPVGRGSPVGRAYWRLEDQARAYIDFAAADVGAADPYLVWRARQKARTAFAEGYVVAPLSLHLPFTVELTQGCSLGCWFCGLSARPLQAVLPTDIDAWEEMLRALRGIFGESAARGFLFWATDPMDHPDYEAHADAFRRVLGRFPTTTTAAATVDLDRTRRLMALARSADYPYPVLRFSVVSLRRLNEIHAAFSPEELADVDFALLNRESVLALAETGHVRDVAKRWPERLAHERSKIEAVKGGSHADDDEIWSHRTICCVSGFLIEPVAGRVRLITPEPSSDRWPDGYAVFGEERFAHADELAGALDRLIADHMRLEPPERLALQRGVTVTTPSRAQARAEGRGHRVLFAAHRDLAHMPALAETFRGGARMEDAVGRVARRFGIDPRIVRNDAADLWRHGVLIETIFDFADAVPQAE